MLNLNLNHAAALFLSLAIASGAMAARPDGSPADYGVATTVSAGQRVVNLTPATTSVNVVNGETVTFTAGGKSFSWHVDTWPGVHQFSLKAIAPQDIAADGVQVYVAPNPLYFGN